MFWKLKLPLRMRNGDSHWPKIWIGPIILWLNGIDAILRRPWNWRLSIQTKRYEISGRKCVFTVIKHVTWSVLKRKYAVGIVSRQWVILEIGDARTWPIFYCIWCERIALNTISVCMAYLVAIYILYESNRLTNWKSRACAITNESEIHL